MFKSLLPWKHTKTKVMVPEQTMEDENNTPETTLIPCATCGRTFLPAPLRKHAPICEKSAFKKRKIFDSLKQRVEGTDLAQFHQKSYLKRQDSTPKTAEKPKRTSHWEESHQKLVDAIRTAKGATREMSPAKKLQSLASNSSNERCPHCERQFGPKAFDRHVEWCKEHVTRVQKSPANVLIAKERLEARIKYKVPPLNKSKKVTIKEKYSASNAVSRTDSVCSVKSTPPNAFRRNLSVRKPKSVLDLGSKIEQQTANNREKTTSVVSLNEITKRPDPTKSLRPKRYCPSRQKVNLTHSENLESITVAPLKFGTHAKKLVTWKEVSEKSSPEKNDDESVIVVYENSSVFGKRRQGFIEELKEILTESDDDNVGASPKSGIVERSSSNFLSVSETRSYPATNSERRDSCKGSLSSNLDGKYSELSIKEVASDLNEIQLLDADWQKCRNSDDLDCDRSGRAPSCEASKSAKRVEACEDSDVSITSSTCYNIERGEEERRESCVRDCSPNIPKDASSASLSLKSFTGDSLKSFSGDSLLSLKSGTPSAKLLDEVIEKFQILTTESRHDARDTASDSLRSQETGSQSLGLQQVEGLFKFNKTVTGGNAHSVIEYEIPKKRRRLNSTFVVESPERVMSNGGGEFGKKLDDPQTNGRFLPKIIGASNRTVTEQAGKKPALCKLPAIGGKPNEFGNLPILETRLKGKDKKRMEVTRDTDGVFLSYESHPSTTPYDPFVSAERQLMELLECDSSFKVSSTVAPPRAQHALRPYTTAAGSVKPSVAKKTAKSAAPAAKTATTTNKRASVIDPPVCFQDPEDDFEMLENLINDQFNSDADEFFLDLNKRNKEDFNVILNKRKYSDDTSSVDSNLINENDNLSIPEHFRFGNYSSDDTDTTIQNDNVDYYSAQYDKKIERGADAKGREVKRSPKVKPKSNCSFGSGDAARTRRRSKEGDSGAKKEGKGGCTKAATKDKTKKVSESSESDISIKPEELFAIDDKMYAEYKIYEEMYLKDKELAANSRKQRNKNPIKSYGIEMLTEEYNNAPAETISNDSAYGSLNRNSPKPKTAKLSPLQRHRMDSASSSGSENFTNQAVLSNQQRMSKFCHECGNKYPLETAKFCPECGVRRLLL